MARHTKLLFSLPLACTAAAISFARAQEVGASGRLATGQSPTLCYENLVVTADFNRGNPGVILQAALAKTERYGNWEKASLARRTGPGLKGWALRNLDPETTGIHHQALFVDLPFWAGWALCAGQLDQEQPFDGIEPRTARRAETTGCGEVQRDSTRRSDSSM